MKVNEKNIANINLKDYFDVEYMRLVPDDARNLSPGAGEIPFYLEPLEGSKIYKKISRVFMDSVKIYGFVTITKSLEELFEKYISGKVEKYYIIFRETDEKFLVIFAGEDEKGAEMYECSKKSMYELMSECLQPNFKLY